MRPGGYLGWENQLGIDMLNSNKGSFHAQEASNEAKWEYNVYDLCLGWVQVVASGKIQHTFAVRMM